MSHMYTCTVLSVYALLVGEQQAIERLDTMCTVVSSCRFEVDRIAVFTQFTRETRRG